jgi:hypothetical protein
MVRGSLCESADHMPADARRHPYKGGKTGVLLFVWTSLFLAPKFPIALLLHVGHPQAEPTYQRQKPTKELFTRPPAVRGH